MSESNTRAETLEVMARALFDRDHNGPFAHKGVTRLTFGRDRITYDEVRKGIDNGVYTASALSICHAEAEAALTALEASGRAVVPVEPTEAMLAAAFKVEREPKPIIGYRRIGAVYSAMLAAHTQEKDA